MSSERNLSYAVILFTSQIITYRFFVINVAYRQTKVKEQKKIDKLLSKFVDFWCGWRDSNPHVHPDTSTSS